MSPHRRLEIEKRWRQIDAELEDTLHLLCEAIVSSVSAPGVFLHSIRTTAAITVVPPETNQFVPFDTMISALALERKPFVHDVLLEDVQLFLGKSSQSIRNHLLCNSGSDLI